MQKKKKNISFGFGHHRRHIQTDSGANLDNYFTILNMSKHYHQEGGDNRFDPAAEDASHNDSRRKTKILEDNNGSRVLAPGTEPMDGKVNEMRSKLLVTTTGQWNRNGLSLPRQDSEMHSEVKESFSLQDEGTESGILSPTAGFKLKLGFSRRKPSTG